MKKKVSFKNLSDESMEIEPIRLSLKDIGQENIFNNKSEIIVKSILEKILINVFIYVKNKDLESLIETRCSNYVFQEINSLLSNVYPCYEKENYHLTDSIFIDNYLREDVPWNECNITQPTPGKMDRWKIHRIEIVNLKNKNKNEISETSEGPSLIYDLKYTKKIKKPKISLTNLQKKIREDKEKEKEKQKEAEEEEKIRNVKLGIRVMDSFPSYPLSDDLFKIDINLTKEQEKQIEEFRTELLLKEELKKKEKEKIQMIEKMKKISQLTINENTGENKKEIKRYRGKSIGVTTNGQIIFIQNVNINSLKSEFLEINTRMKNVNKRGSNASKNTTNKFRRKSIDMNDNKNNYNNVEIEKNYVDESMLDFYKINNKEKMSQQIITGGSSFKNFVPETGVNLKQNGDMKSGGNDFLNKYKKISLEQFRKTLEYFKRTNNNEILEIKKDNNSQNNNNNFNNSNALNSQTNNNFNQKSLIKSSSLPELNQINSRTNFESSNIFNAINNINDSNIKNSFNYTNYNNSNFMNSTKYNNMNNFIKTSSSFKYLFRNENQLYKEDNIIPNYTTKQFFKKFNLKKNISVAQNNERNSFAKIQDFNMNILKSNNWGSFTSQHNRNNIKLKPLINKSKKKDFTKTINGFNRVRSNVNETYFRKMRIFNKISLRSQSTDNNGNIKNILFDKSKK